MKTFLELRELNVNEFIEKKGNLSYLSWTHAVDVMLQNDPGAVWEFPEPTFYKGGSVMVHCLVYAFGKTVRMHLPVMDYKNNSVIDPSSRQISDAMMRCLAKCIACFGIGLYIYAGEDLPESFDDEPVQPVTNQQKPLSKSELDLGVKDISTAPDESALRQVFSDWYRLAKSANDENALTIFTNCKDERKKQFA